MVLNLFIQILPLMKLTKGYCQKWRFLATLLLLLLSLTITNSQTFTFNEDKLRSNMVVTSKYAIIGQYQMNVPTLRKLDLATMKMETISYPPVEQWINFFRFVLLDLGQGEIAFGCGRHLLILNNQTLQLKQVVQNFSKSIVGDISAFYNGKTNQSALLVGSDSYSTYVEVMKLNGSETYNQVEQRFATDYLYRSDLKATSPNSASYYRNYQLSTISNLRSIVDRKTDEKYFFKHRQYVALSYNEATFVLRNQKKQYEFYSLQQDYETPLRSTFFINNNQHSKALFTDDDQFLFLSLKNGQIEYNVARVDVARQGLILIADSDGSSKAMVSFTLFAAKYDRFVTLAKRSSSHYIQLRKISTLEIVDQKKLSFDLNVLQYKLVGSIEWGLSFGVVARILPYLAELDKDSKVFLFSAEADRLSPLNVEPLDGSFPSLEAVYKYIITYKETHSSETPYPRLYHYSNFSLAAELNSKYVYSYAIEKNVLVVNDAAYYVYDLQQSLQIKGWFYRIRNFGVFPIIFNRRGILYQVLKQQYEYQGTTRTIYNISHPAITSTVDLITSEWAPDWPIIYVQAVGDGRQIQPCNLIFDVQNLAEDEFYRRPKIVKYNQCTRQVQKYLIAQLNQVADFAQIHISSDRKYLIAWVRQVKASMDLIQVREISDLTKVYYQHYFPIPPDDNMYDLFADISEGKTVILKTYNYAIAHVIDHTHPQATQAEEAVYNLMKE